MNGDSRTAPVRPPPGPPDWAPGAGVFGPGCGAAARARVVLGLVERDDEQAVAAEGGRSGDPRYPRPQEGIGGGEAAGAAVGARGVVAVVAEVGRDEAEVGRARRGGKVGPERRERDVARRAAGAVVD